ncbi:MAG: hypothetical protein GY814_12925, partial [Gammaproteobacteria bacterium]|nr:hypothetical protein [Gammaproteobacteria bacterium]
MNEAEKEKILKLSALFKELAEKGTWFESIDTKGVWHKNAFPEPVSDLSRWRVADKPVEPKKIIVLTKCINTIDMEFARHDENWSIGKLDGIYGHSYPYS